MVPELIKNLPLIRGYRRRRYRKRFQRELDWNLFYGVYGGFEEARADAPVNLPVGYDNPDSAVLYDGHLEETWPEYYPALFWLASRWKEMERVLDFGGHRGALYYAATRVLGPGPEWIVYDVPAVVEEGRALASERGEERLTFQDHLSAIPEVDTVVAAGSLQYVEWDAETWLERLPGSPRCIILSATPFHPTRDFVTLNNIGSAYCPYRVRRNGEFFRTVEAAGYRRAGEWRHPAKSLSVPFHVPPGEVVYRGAVFIR